MGSIVSLIMRAIQKYESLKHLAQESVGMAGEGATTFTGNVPPLACSVIRLTHIKRWCLGYVGAVSVERFRARVSGVSL